MGGGAWAGGVGVGGGGKSSPGESGPQLPPDGPEHPNQAEETSLRPRVDFQAGHSQLARSRGANLSAMVLQGYKFTPHKSRPIESGHGRHAVQVAIKCS